VAFAFGRNSEPYFCFALLNLDLAPQQISGWLKIQYPADESMRLSHETIYATLVERHSRFTALVKVRSKDTAAVVAALSGQIHRLPASLRRSLTWDRGLEMAKHKTFTVATNVKVYFCDPHSPWQRGTNENTNRLLRQYLPKRTDLSGYTQSQLDKTALRLNQRLRKTLGFQTPASKLRASVAPTV
jgi:IS30 family transposase